VIHGFRYLGERDVSVETPVSQSEKMCVLQVEQIFFKKNLSEYLSNYWPDIVGTKYFLQLKIEPHYLVTKGGQQK